MVICSCSVITDQRVKEYLSKRNFSSIPSADEVVRGLGHETICGTCARRIKEIIREYYER
jgi:bacterioferritin-associated ferredoxin